MSHYAIDGGLFHFCPQCGAEFAPRVIADRTATGEPVVCGACGCGFNTHQDRALMILANWLRGKDGRFLRCVSNRRMIRASESGGFVFSVQGKKSYDVDDKETYPTLPDAIVASEQYGIPTTETRKD